MKREVFRIASKQEMELLAERIASHFSANEAVLLSGVLGAGKTFFSSLIAKSLGVKEPVVSPTFALCREYSFNLKNVPKKILHFDFYRLNSYSQIQDLAFENIISNRNNLVLIEWPESIVDLDLAKKIKTIAPQRKIYQMEISFAKNLKDRKIILRYE